MDRKANRNAVFSLVASVLGFIAIVAYLILTVRSITTAFPGEPLTNPRIYNQTGVVVSIPIVMLLAMFGIIGAGNGGQSIKNSRAQGMKPPVLAVMGLILGLLDNFMVVAILGFLVYLLTVFMGMK